MLVFNGFIKTYSQCYVASHFSIKHDTQDNSHNPTQFRMQTYTKTSESPDGANGNLSY